MIKEVVFRADGSSSIGLGHVIRSLAVADMLKDDFHCSFIIKSPSDSLKKTILYYCYTCHIIKENESLESEIDFVKNLLSEEKIIVLDGYHFDSEYQKSLKETSAKMVCIDDIYDEHFVSDAVINHAPALSKEIYSRENYTDVFLGLDYSLLREPFLNQSDYPREISEVKNVFLCFGGADFNNITCKALQALLTCDYTFETINVILGGAFKFKDEVLEIVHNSDQNIKLHSNLNANEMASLMKTCDFAIVPASSILYEICSINMFVISGFYVDNQVNVNRGFKSLNLIHSVGDFNSIVNLDTEITNYLNSRDKKQLEIQHSKFNGKSKINIINIFKNISINLRAASLKDVDLLFKWVNEPLVRENSINQEPIVYENHVQWFKKSLSDTDCKIFVLENGEDTLGQVRVNVNERREAYIDYSIDKDSRGKGYGRIIISKLIGELRKSSDALQLVAEVKTSNKASCKVFEKLHFSKGISENKDLEVYYYKL